MHYALSTRLLVAIGSWCFARAGIEWQLKTPRDKRGRFRPKHGGGYGFPREVPHKVADLLHGMGVTQQMYEHAYVPLVLPDDIEDIEALERRLREWISANINHWVTDGRRSIGMVMRALMWTYAIGFYRYQPPQKMVAWYMRHVAAGTRVNYIPPDEAMPGTSGKHSHQAAMPPRQDTPTADLMHSVEPLQSSSDVEHGVGLSVNSVPAPPTTIPVTRDPFDLTWRRGVVAVNQSIHGPDPPWFRPPPHPPPSTHGTLKT